MRYSPLLPLAFLLGCATADQPATETPSTTPATATINRAFDVPALLGLSANDIARPLAGQGIRPDQNAMSQNGASGTTETVTTYWHDSTGLDVSYDPTTLRVNSFFVKPKSGHTTNYETLLKLANVSRYDKRVSIEPIASVDNPQVYTGVKITPQTPTASAQ
ncbi:hypothetical protein [Hymenobacter properus]|uniref:Uncharacterized protein n=1 Tax=Hymenobacter properus TaxID=2791026 RepID=A0A931BHI3_9BACT|nr:hypothetical protein [Hymenobacter properus]MBF9144054.1 hypothetical protein [Hymenobacter properus]MBR7722871.1 hypothetical protein [Microvirga sp. SRT04]